MADSENRVDKGYQVSCLGCCKRFFLPKQRPVPQPIGKQRWGWCIDCRELELPRAATQNRLFLPLDRSGLRPG